jgi:hypothetical protein
MAISHEILNQQQIACHRSYDKSNQEFHQAVMTLEGL